MYDKEIGMKYFSCVLIDKLGRVHEGNLQSFYHLGAELGNDDKQVDFGLSVVNNLFWGYVENC